MKRFKFHNAEMTIEQMHMYGHYVLKGMGTSVMTTDSEIWDHVDDDENPEKAKEAQRHAYHLLQNNK